MDWASLGFSVLKWIAGIVVSVTVAVVVIPPLEVWYSRRGERKQRRRMSKEDRKADLEMRNRRLGANPARLIAFIGTSLMAVLALALITLFLYIFLFLAQAITPQARSIIMLFPLALLFLVIQAPWSRLADIYAYLSEETESIEKAEPLTVDGPPLAVADQSGEEEIERDRELDEVL